MRRIASFAAVFAFAAGVSAVAGASGGPAPGTDFCVSEWPGSSVMQEYCRQSQRRAAQEIERFANSIEPGSPEARRLERCAGQWGDDLELRARCLDAPSQIVGQM